MFYDFRLQRENARGKELGYRVFYLSTLHIGELVTQDLLRFAGIARLPN